MIEKSFFTLIFFLLISSKFIPSQTVDLNNLVVELEHKNFDYNFFMDNDFYYTTLKLDDLYEFPKYTNYLEKNYIGIPKNDSLQFYNCIKDVFFSSDIIKNGDSLPKRFIIHKKENVIDTINRSKVKLKSTIIVVVGFYKNKQFMIADANRNKDFSDDIKYEYDINFRKNPYENIDLINKQPVTEYSYEDCYKGNIQTYNRRFTIYPDRNNPFALNQQDPTKFIEGFSILKFRDYWMGETTINNKIVEFYYHGYSNHYGILYAKPKEVKFIKGTYNFDGSYKFKYYATDKIDDTINVAGEKFRIDSISRDISKLYLKKCPKKENGFGYQIGDNIKNIEFEDLNNKSFNTKNIIGKKKYTLLEFWGTWCGPCVAMTPELLKTEKKYSNSLNIISVAVDKNKTVVQKYITKHKINWKIGYIPQFRNWGNPILKQLNIQSFPTFILIDFKGRILYRGSSDSFDEILNLIK